MLRHPTQEDLRACEKAATGPNDRSGTPGEATSAIDDLLKMADEIREFALGREKEMPGLCRMAGLIDTVSAELAALRAKVEELTKLAICQGSEGTAYYYKDLAEQQAKQIETQAEEIRRLNAAWTGYRLVPKALHYQLSPEELIPLMEWADKAIHDAEGK